MIRGGGRQANARSDEGWCLSFSSVTNSKETLNSIAELGSFNLCEVKEEAGEAEMHIGHCV